MGRLPDWARPFLVTLGLAVLVAAGVAGDEGPWFALVVVGTAVVGFGTLFRLFPGGVDLAVGAANGFAVYACLFTVIGRAAFPDAPRTAAALAFVLPVLAFLAAVWRQRRALGFIIRSETPTEARHLWRIGRWLLSLAGVAAVSLSFPANRMPGMEQGSVLLVAMALVGALVAANVREVVRFLVDMALLLNDLGGRAVALAVPVAAYVSLFSLITIAFACFYRIADALSRGPLFAGPAGPMRLAFRDALHFSIVTVSTVGYGDIWPEDDGVRLLAAAEVLAGQILLLFGFYEITRSRLSPEAAKAERQADREEDRMGDRPPGRD
ncbi:ion channel [Roseomonas sp. CCTCC AB2023176]|uniref:ion channel n=1 Tax=Roseomonas sp. CCTCC AB2023176 TaxID=3342640 RepID=UPI0035D8602B